MPLSSAQLRLWFLNQLEGSDSDTYHLSGAHRFDGRLDLQAMHTALDSLVARHPMLRATFDEVDGEPSQRIAPAAPVAICVIDLTGLSPEERETEARRQMAEECTAPFDLRNGPLFRGRVLRMEAQRHLLVITMHHIVSDGWSIAVLMRDFGAFYTASVQGLPDLLPAPTADYRDHVLDEKQRASSPLRLSRLAHWQRHLEGAPGLLALPTDRPRPARQSHAGAHVDLTLQSSLVTALKSWAKLHGATLPMALHAGLAALLSRLSGQHDIVIGMPVANRRRPAYRPLVGLFVNTLALRVDLADDPNAGELLDRVRAVAQAGYQRQDVPFEQVVDALQPERDAGHSPIFQVMLAMHNFDAEPMALPHGTLQLVELPPSDVQFDLALSLRETADGIAGRIAYPTALFDQATIRRWAGYFTRLLQAMAEGDARPVGELPIIDIEERALLLHGFAGTETTPGPEAPSLVHRLFEAQVARTPKAVALVAGDRSWRYEDLDRAADRLAARLRMQGVGPDERVALIVGRHADTVLAILAVLKAGGAYVPLDPADPPDRIARMLADAAPRVVLTHAALQASLAPHGVPTLLLDDPAGQDAQDEAASSDTVPTQLTPKHLAYVIYTSGSTGMPKGVAMPHSTLVNLVRWQCDDAPPMRTLQFAAIGFDVAFQEIFTTLCAGGTLLIADDATRRDPEALARVLLEQRIERVFLPFIALQHLAQWLAQRPQPLSALPALPALRQVITAGEQLRIGADLRHMFRQLPDCRLVNHYGPTETHVVTAETLDATTDAWPLLPAIGRPIANARITILDALGEPVPIGVAGEIHIGGATLARGYLQRPELTGERFEADAHSAATGGRRYKTGDVGRWRADGRIDFLGRNDRQIKLRGFRIEPAEIEAQLMRHPQVDDAAVVLCADTPGAGRLVAYLVAAAKLGAPADDDLRQHLRAHLPPYMVPAALMWLPALPLTASGKVDRQALPAPADAEQTPARRMPRDATEQALWDIWSEVLASASFGIDDSFFELGGHSLLTTQVASRVHRRLGVELPLKTLFEHVSIAELAARITAMRHDPPGKALVTIARVRRGAPLPVSLSQRRMWVTQQFDPHSVAYNVGIALRLRGPLDRDLLQRAFDTMVERHEGLRTHFAMHGNEPAQIIVGALPASIEQVDLRSLPAGERVPKARNLLRDRVSTPFDLARAPLHRVTLVQLGDGDHVLLWLLHHAITDNWSIAILLREVLALYAAWRTGATPELPPLAIEYGDYAAWQRSPDSVARRQHQLAYWLDRLRGLAPLDLPTDFARPQQPSFRGAKVSTVLAPKLRVAVREFCGRHGTTPFVVLLSAFKLLLARHAGSDDIAVGTPIANRNHLATEQLVGTLVNTLVLRTGLEGDPSFSELVLRVRATALDAFANEDAPFDELVDALGQDRAAQPGGIVRVLFNVLNAPLGRLEPVDFSYEEFDLERPAAQFDLSIHIDTEFSHRVHLEYSTDLYAQVTAERMLENYLALVEQVVAEPERALSSFVMVAPAQLDLLRHGWNATRAPLPPELLVHRHLRTADAALADVMAVLDASNRSTSYGELESRANALARVLRARGIGRGHRVGLCVARDAGMLAAQLAVLKSGAAYVPLDPGFPVERLIYMAGDAALSAILVAADLAGTFSETGVPLLHPEMPSLAAGFSNEPLAPDAERDARPLDAAYLIYTSGSTGRPKGVVVPHRAVVNFLMSMAHAPGLQSVDRLVAVTTLSFDIAVLELFLPLVVGASVIVASRDEVSDPNRLRELLVRHEATVMQATPSAWRALVESGWSGRRGFRALIGGESLPATLAEELLARCDELWNMYGPTETTVWSTCCRVHSPREGISIGRPIANTSVWVLDALGQPSPIGVPGEACIGGLGVTLGYHERELLTAERFVPDTLGDSANARLYRTGDLVRWRYDGVLEHLGRLDHQVKVRGFRIELGEIESVLLDHPAVAQCVVVTRSQRDDDVRLVAYVVLRDAAVDPAGLRTHLRDALPGYMVPQHLVALPALPLLPNGKIDRGALPAPDTEMARQAAVVASPPTTPEEKVVAAIWAGLLGIDDVRKTDNFFDLGGHSLLAMRAVAAIEQQLGLHVEPRRLVFETLKQVAHRANDEAHGAPGRGRWMNRVVGR